MAVIPPDVGFDGSTRNDFVERNSAVLGNVPVHKGGHTTSRKTIPRANRSSRESDVETRHELLEEDPYIMKNFHELLEGLIRLLLAV